MLPSRIAKKLARSRDVAVLCECATSEYAKILIHRPFMPERPTSRRSPTASKYPKWRPSVNRRRVFSIRDSLAYAVRAPKARGPNTTRRRILARAIIPMGSIAVAYSGDAIMPIFAHIVFYLANIGYGAFGSRDVSSTVSRANRIRRLRCAHRISVHRIALLWRRGGVTHRRVGRAPIR